MLSKRLHLLLRTGGRAAAIGRTTAIRHYSIEEFNKKKTEYSFGMDLNASKHTQLLQQHEKQLQENYNTALENHPDLAGLDRSKPEFKDALYALHQKQQTSAKEEQKKYESRERFKAVFYGLSTMLAIVCAHQLMMNYEYFTNWLTHGSTYGLELDDTKAKELHDPSHNENNFENLVAKYTDVLDDPAVLAAVQPLSTPGLYLFGGKNKRKFPLRVPFFDHKLLRDVQLSDTLLVAIGENGYELHELPIGDQNGKQAKSKVTKHHIPVTTKLPFRAKKTQITANYIYVLSDSGSVYYKVRSSANETSSSFTVPFEGYTYRNYLGLARTSATFGKLNTQGLVDIAAGELHLLLLSKDGKVFGARTSEASANNGQFGMPKYAPFTGVLPEINSTYELTNLNYELVSGAQGRTTRQRVFTHIAAGESHNLAADASGNVWTWGKNTFGECGKEISYRTDVQAVPTVALGVNEYTRLTKPKKDDKNATSGPLDWNVSGLFAGNDTSYVKVTGTTDHSAFNDYLITFGNGLKGQLGLSVYYHVCPKPQIVKALTGHQEYDETLNRVVNIGIKNVYTGGEHAFVTLTGSQGNDVMCFGDNEYGQLGNGKFVKSSKPTNMPKLIEPEELGTFGDENKHELTKRMVDFSNHRLQLTQDGKKWKQELVAGENSSAIFYTKP